MALTSAQVLKKQHEESSESNIQRTEVEVLKSMMGRKTETFVDSIEEDTEEIEMSFEEYLANINENRRERQVSPTESANMEDLEILLNASENDIANLPDAIPNREAE